MAGQTQNDSCRLIGNPFQYRHCTSPRILVRLRVSTSLRLFQRMDQTGQAARIYIAHGDCDTEFSARGLGGVVGRVRWHKHKRAF